MHVSHNRVEMDSYDPAKFVDTSEIICYSSRTYRDACESRCLSRILRIDLSKEGTQCYSEVLKDSCFGENFHSDVAGFEIRDIQVNNPARVLLSSRHRIDERIVFPHKIYGDLSRLFNGLNCSHTC